MPIQNNQIKRLEKNMEKISFLNGEFLPHSKCFIHIEDRSVQFADSIYEVVLFKNGKLVDCDWHFDRLFRSLEQMQINFHHQSNLGRGELKNIFLELFEKNNLQEGSVYLQITRGVAPRTAGIPECKPTIISTVKEIDKNAKSELSAIFYPDIRWGRCDIKSTALFASSVAKQNAVNRGFDEVIMTRDGFITEASFANVFMVDHQNNLITPLLDQNILGGITRKRIIVLAKENGINVVERKITVEEMLNAQEIFVSSSTLAIRPVVSLDKKFLGVGKITKNLIGFYDSYLLS